LDTGVEALRTLAFRTLAVADKVISYAKRQGLQRACFSKGPIPSAKSEGGSICAWFDQHLSLKPVNQTCAQAQVVLHVGGGVGHLCAQPIRFDRADRKTVFQLKVEAAADI
jgi:hypothetical protein